MTLAEALKTGRRFRRPGSDWISSNTQRAFEAEEVLVDEWEAEPEKRLRRIAWIAEGTVVLRHSDAQPGYPHWVRAPWLDEPETK